MTQPMLGAPASRTTAPPPATRQRNLILTVVIAVLAFFLIGRLFPHENRYERLATDITKAIANNDMRPVEKNFNAIRRPELQDRARVGALANLVAPLGKLKGSKENTPPNSPDGVHQFTEQFERGTLLEKYRLDGDGKVVNFHIGPNTAP